MHGNNFQYEGNYDYAESLNDGVGKALFMNASSESRRKDDGGKGCAC